MLKLNVGLSRKVADNNYGSRGASVNVELEVESALATEPGKLKERIRQVFGLVRESLVEELNGSSNGQTHGSNGANGHGQGTNGKSENGQKTSTPRPATQSQLRAISAIAKRLHINLEDLLGKRFQVQRTQDLSIKQASQLIDDLNANKEGG